MPNSRTLVLEARDDPQRERGARERTPGSGRMGLAASTVALATALTLLGAPAAEALRLF